MTIAQQHFDQPMTRTASPLALTIIGYHQVRLAVSIDISQGNTLGESPALVINRRGLKSAVSIAEQYSR